MKAIAPAITNANAGLKLWSKVKNDMTLDLLLIPETISPAEKRNPTRNDIKTSVLFDSSLKFLIIKIKTPKIEIPKIVPVVAS